MPTQNTCPKLTFILLTNFTCREHDLVLVPAVVGVDHGRRRAPQGAVHLRTQPFLLRSAQVAQNAQNVLEKVLWVHLNVVVAHAEFYNSILLPLGQHA